MAQLALIIGNGFDIDMGLPSKYSDFAKSPEFRDLVKRMRDMYYIEEQDKSLVLQLQKAYAESNWFDIEEEIHKYVVEHTYLNDQILGLIRSEFDELKKALYKYLQRITTNFTANEEKLSTYLLYRLRECPLTVAEIFFNYTNPHEYLKAPLQPEIFNGTTHLCSYVHGSLRNNDMEAREIIFFGHSINEMDFCYFREFFKVASTSPNSIRHLTIITYDEESERAIKDNIQNQGISVSDLYNSLTSFSFIHTTKMNANDKDELDKWDSLIKRILTPRVRGVKIRN